MKGGFLRHGFKVTKRGLIGGLVGGGVGLVLGCPGEGAAIGAGGSALWTNNQPHKTGLIKRSEKAFAQATLAKMEGHRLKGQMYKLKGVAYSGLEFGALGGINTGMLGIIGGAGIGTLGSGLVLGAVVGGGYGLCRAYVAPAVNKALVNRSLSNTERAITQLARDPQNVQLHGKLQKELGKLVKRADRVPILNKTQNGRYEHIKQVLSQSPLAEMAAGL